VSTNQKPAFSNPEWIKCYLMKARIVKKQWNLCQIISCNKQKNVETPKNWIYKTIKKI